MDSTELIRSSKEPGLFIVSTPIGNLGDITYRAINTLKMADLVLCEDTRETRKLLSHYNVSTKTDSYNDHNGGEKRPAIMRMLHDGAMVALVSDAGTPLVSDPGYKLVADALENGIRVYPVPGASSILAALVMSGMPSDVFTFCGFADAKKFKNFADYNSTLIFFESARRLVDCLGDMEKAFVGRTVAVCREITKMYEENRFGSFANVREHFEAHPAKGEVVILLSPPLLKEKDVEDIREELLQLLKTMKLKDASELLGEKYGMNKKKIYELGLSFKN